MFYIDYAVSCPCLYLFQVDIFSKDIVLIPVLNDRSWAAAVINFRKKQIELYDSTGAQRDDVYEVRP